MITLTSDFGSIYPAAMRGVILRQTDARLVDVTHDLPRGDVRAASFWLRFVLPEFPPAVHLVVVDPGVGTDRRAIVVRAGDHALVGPDNGSLLPPARALSDGEIEAFEIDVADPDSQTFHGRDVFAPYAAAVHEVGVESIDDVATLAPIDDPIDVRLPDPTVSAEGRLIDAEVLVVDRFGNVITNVPGETLGEATRVRIDGERVPVAETFGAVDRGEKLLTVGSHGYVELDVNDGRGDEAFDLAAGDVVRIRIGAE
ncbi:MAG: SAM hydrolase/SAM-dependent halogenase family protein [Halobacteriota archaeon]